MNLNHNVLFFWDAANLHPIDGKPGPVQRGKTIVSVPVCVGYDTDVTATGRDATY